LNLKGIFKKVASLLT
uniref:Eumenitin n=1 Tax=Eumenes rubronotatus TaxID=539890 RepID=EUME_EUMRU|nr:RecName: Full=Eumenitin; AltName: Full=Er-12 [Eumenes rubronotatus]